MTAISAAAINATIPKCWKSGRSPCSKRVPCWKAGDMAAAILIWGAGAIGGSAGAWLKRAGHDITFVDVVPEHVAAIRDTGLHITGPVEEFIVHASAFTPEELTGTWQRIFLSV